MHLVGFIVRIIRLLFTADLSAPFVYILKCNTLYMLCSKKAGAEKCRKIVEPNLTLPSLTYTVSHIVIYVNDIVLHLTESCRHSQLLPFRHVTSGYI